MGYGAQSINTSLDMLNSMLNYRAQKESRDANLAMGLLRLETARINREEDNINRQREIKIAEFNSMRNELSKVMTLNDNISKVSQEDQSPDADRMLANIHNKQLRNMYIARNDIKEYDKKIQGLRLERAKYDTIRNKVIAEYDKKAENGLKIDTITATQLEKYAGIEDLDKFYKEISNDTTGKYKKGIYDLAEALKKNKFSRTEAMYDRREQERRDRFARQKYIDSKKGKSGINMNDLLRPLAGGLNPEIDLWNKELKKVDDSNLSGMSALPLSIKTKSELKGWLKANANNFANSLVEGDANDGWFLSDKIDDKKALYYYKGYTNKDNSLKKRKQFASLLFQRFAEHPEIVNQLDSADAYFTSSNPKKVKVWEDMLTMNQRAMHGYAVVDQLEKGGIIPKSILDTNESSDLSDIDKAFQASLPKHKPESKTEKSPIKKEEKEFANPKELALNAVKDIQDKGIKKRVDAFGETIEEEVPFSDTDKIRIALEKEKDTKKKIENDYSYEERRLNRRTDKKSDAYKRIEKRASLYKKRLDGINKVIAELEKMFKDVKGK